MHTFCSFCGAPNAADARFCVRCRKLIALGTRNATASQPAPSSWLDDDWVTAASMADPAFQPLPQVQQPWPPPAPGPGALQSGTLYGQWPTQTNEHQGYRPPQLDLSQPPYASVPGSGTHPNVQYPTATARYAQQPDPYLPMHAPSPWYGQAPAYPAPYPPPSYNAGVTRMAPGTPADFWPRFGALMVDYCVLAVIWFTLLGVAAFIDSAALGLLSTFLGPAFYFIGFWSTSGRTPGYRAAGLQLVRTDGTKPTLGVSIARYIGTMISWSFFCLGYLWMLWDRERQTWHDKIAGTQVINLR